MKTLFRNSTGLDVAAFSASVRRSSVRRRSIFMASVRFGLCLILLSALGVVARAEVDSSPPPAAKMVVPPTPKPISKRGVKYSTEVQSRACGDSEKNPGHDVFVVAKRAKDGSVKWRTQLWTWVHPCTQKTIDGKPVALGHVGILPVSMKLDKKVLHVMSNRDQDFEISVKDGKLREAPAPELGGEPL